MAFLSRAPEAESARTRRFSLLLLDHNDVYFEDTSVSMYLTETDARPIKGRLKICGNCALFDPKEVMYPIYKFSYQKCTKIGRWANERLGLKGFVISCTEYVKMKEDNLTRPYQFIKPEGGHARFFFEPSYSDPDEIIAKLQTLHSAWQDRSFNETQTRLRAHAEQHQSNVVFNPAWIEDLSETMVLERMIADRVTPLTRNKGRLVLSSARIYFQPFNNIDPEPVVKFSLEDIRSILPRRFLLRNIGLELIMEGGSSVYFAFDDPKQRQIFLDALRSQPALRLKEEDDRNMMLAWQNGAVSNFDYLMYLNSRADRSFVDLAQYPVMPWVITDYDSSTLDFNDPNIYRDLTKPVGALNPERLEDFRQRYTEMPEPKFFYGTHYSTPGYVLFYTIRVAPDYSLNLQNGKFDQADRLFRSVKDTFINALTGAGDVKELIPEFYMEEGPNSGNFLLNSDNLEFGFTQRGDRVHDVQLPPWASSAKDFISSCRQALESDYVSERLHHWIDLIFGYKQRGPEAVKAENVFYYLTYEGAVDLETIVDPAEREAYELQIMEFGQTPRQLYTIPHPQRHVGGPGVPRPLAAASSSSSSARVVHLPVDEPLEIVVNSKTEDGNTDVVVTHGRPTLDGLDAADSAAAEGSAAAAATFAAAPVSWSTFDRLEHHITLNIHRDVVTAVAFSADGNTMYSCSQDSCLRVHSLKDQQQLQSTHIGDLGLSSILVLPDGDTLLLGSWDSHVYVYSVDYAAVIHKWAAHHDAVSDLRILDNRLLTASWDSTVKVWQCDFVNSKRSTPDAIATLTEHEGEVTTVAVHPGRNIAVSSGNDGVVCVWDLGTYLLLRQFEPHLDRVHSLVLSADGLRFISCSADSYIKVTEVDTGVELMAIRSDDEPKCMDSDGTVALVGNDSGVLELWNLAQGERVESFSRHKGAIECLCVRADARQVLTAGVDGCFTLWQVAA